MASKDDAIYQLKVTLGHVKPPVWRRLLVPASIELPALHRVLQAA
ncbi:MAG: IS1096 element passenger TnpR family protein, partial [Dongiaceae bacterium]